MQLHLFWLIFKLWVKAQNAAKFVLLIFRKAGNWVWDLALTERRAPRAFTPRKYGLQAEKQSIHFQTETKGLSIVLHYSNRL